MKRLKSYAKGFTFIVTDGFSIGGECEQEMIEQIGSGGGLRNGYVHVIGYGVRPGCIWCARS